MKIKTSELNAVALDWAVAKCEGFKYMHIIAPWQNKHGAYGNGQVMVSNQKDSSYDFNPSENWNAAGPIIEREKIATMYWTGKCEWAAKADSKKANEPNHFGPTPLVSAMRCYVASKLGDEVEVPAELGGV